MSRIQEEVYIALRDYGRSPPEGVVSERFTVTVQDRAEAKEAIKEDEPERADDRNAQDDWLTVEVRRGVARSGVGEHTVRLLGGDSDTDPTGVFVVTLSDPSSRIAARATV